MDGFTIETEITNGEWFLIFNKKFKFKLTLIKLTPCQVENISFQLIHRSTGLVRLQFYGNNEFEDLEVNIRYEHRKKPSGLYKIGENKKGLYLAPL